MTPEQLQQATEGLNRIEVKLVESLVSIEAKLAPDDIVFLRSRIARSLGDHLDLISKLVVPRYLTCDISVADADGNFPPLAE